MILDRQRGLALRISETCAVPSEESQPPSCMTFCPMYFFSKACLPILFFHLFTIYPELVSVQVTNHNAFSRFVQTAAFSVPFMCYMLSLDVKHCAQHIGALSPFHRNDQLFFATSSLNSRPSCFKTKEHRLTSSSVGCQFIISLRSFNAFLRLASFKGVSLAL